MSNNEFDILKQHVLNTVVPAMPGNLNAIVPLLYEGDIAGSEFIVNNANKVYIVVNILVGYNGVMAVNPPYLYLMNHAGAVLVNSTICGVIWNGTTLAPNYTGIHLEIRNAWCSHIIRGTYTSIKFIGYRLTTV
jgi:hypothetical protein